MAVVVALAAAKVELFAQPADLWRRAFDSRFDWPRRGCQPAMCPRPLTHSRSGWRSPARTPAVDGIIQDKFVGRALTSYTGVVGTEYTRDENVNFWELDNCGDNDHILRDTRGAVETAAVGEILFIKGSAYEGSKPLVHRSPAKKFHADGCILNRLLLKVNVPTRS